MFENYKLIMPGKLVHLNLKIERASISNLVRNEKTALLIDISAIFQKIKYSKF